ncbi:MAG: hypothetical protein JEZ08_01855 [Clostridiales bacterium]|nr:hypothetical protein [Clostridiales bacterium]
MSGLLIITGAFSISINATILREFASFSLNLILVVGALGLAIFALAVDEKWKNTKANRDEVMIRYVGELFVLLSLTMLGYVISIFGTSMPAWGITCYGIAMISSSVYFIKHTLASIVAYFNIRD